MTCLPVTHRACNPHEGLHRAVEKDRGGRRQHLERPCSLLCAASQPCKTLAGASHAPRATPALCNPAPPGKRVQQAVLRAPVLALVVAQNPCHPPLGVPDAVRPTSTSCDRATPSPRSRVAETKARTSAIEAPVGTRQHQHPEQ